MTASASRRGTGSTSASTALLTDMYEYTMLSAMVEDGSVHHEAVFEAFARRLPEGRRFGLFAGLGRLLPLLEGFAPDAEDLTYLREVGAITEATEEYLRDWTFTGTITALPEGSLYWPHTPLLTVHGTLGECLLLETLVLSVLNFDSAIASAAARMVIAAGDRPLIEMGSRRVHEEAAVAAARAAWIAGFATTSNLEAGRRFGVPVAGTAAHAATLARPTERDAFAAQIATYGPGTTLLVDTYDIPAGIRTAVEVAGTGLGAVRIDSGDLMTVAPAARAQLDALGATSTRITVTSDLDEYALVHLAGAPIDGYGVGTRVATGSDHPTAGMVYKLVAVGDGPGTPLRSVQKLSADKGSTGGAKTASRFPDGREVWTLDGSVPEGASPVHVDVIRDGVPQRVASAEEAREVAAASLASLPARAREISEGQAFRASEQWDEAGTGDAGERSDGGETTDDAESPRDGGAADASRTLVVVDVQNDFCEGGALGVTGGNAVAERIAAHLSERAGDYRRVVFSRDWHLAEGDNGGHFALPPSAPDFVDTWPVHCVQGTRGAEYHPAILGALERLVGSGAEVVHVVKGEGTPDYSLAQGRVAGVDGGAPAGGTDLPSLLTGDVDVTGLAFDYCVAASARDIAALPGAGTVRVLEDLTAAVHPEADAETAQHLAEAGIRTVSPAASAAPTDSRKDA
ncbi:nicotinate phosphoribosyltransferase [Brachybacterium sp. MASK1Z-5]|uniref:nicotinate phosphoribosyltransferase n=1 Tax=Brachybacterium halotolerans TaxID=2795215 RepID=A0ABS1BDZ7_9MICO|nr:nicotinate phosphoribosyltransferase [Brachybacterium halotolerans]MBK0332869.1 nicotinate phosphoribosyltransferase [Brachybacterium halotolerans]